MLTYGSEAWTVCKRDERRIRAADMKYMRRAAGCTRLDYRKNLDTMKELSMQTVVEFIGNYRCN